jgi:hypothetical protein
MSPVHRCGNGRQSATLQKAFEPAGERIRGTDGLLSKADRCRLAAGQTERDLFYWCSNRALVLRPRPKKVTRFTRLRHP